MTRRLLALAAAVIIAGAHLLLPLPATAADWRPEPADRLAALDAEMAPLLVQFQPAFEVIVADFGVMSAPYRFEGVAAAAQAMQERLDAARRLPDSIAYALGLAHDALAVLDRHPPEACWMDYSAVLRSGWVLFGDGASHLQMGLMDDANRFVGIALFMLGTYGTLIHDQAVEDCAG